MRNKTSSLNFTSRPRFNLKEFYVLETALRALRLSWSVYTLLALEVVTKGKA